MRAIQFHEYGGPEVLRCEEVPDPEPGPGEVLIQIQAAGVNPVDTYIRAGLYGPRPMPMTPGFDAAGVVAAVGEGVTAWKPGDRVYTAGTRTGAYAEKAAALAAQVYPLPENVSFLQGAGVNTPYATAYRALIGRCHALAGETVLVHGASGGVGIAAVQLARALGLTVFGTAGTEEGVELVRREGAHAVFDHRVDGYIEQAVAATPGGRGFDIVLEMLANVNLDRDLKAVAARGRIAVIGNRGTIEINPRDAMAKDAAILGVLLFNTPPDELSGIHRALFAGLENGTLRPVVGRTFPLAEASAAHAAVLAPGHRGKIVLTL